MSTGDIPSATASLKIPLHSIRFSWFGLLCVTYVSCLAGRGAYINITDGWKFEVTFGVCVAKRWVLARGCVHLVPGIKNTQASGPLAVFLWRIQALGIG